MEQRQRSSDEKINKRIFKEFMEGWSIKWLAWKYCGNYKRESIKEIENVIRGAVEV